MKTNLTLKSLTLLLFLAFMTSGGLYTAGIPEKNRDIELSEIKELTDGNTAFSMNLYHQLGKEEGNIFFSPYSISTALAMTYAGARGETEKEMAQVLHFTLPQETLHPAFFKLSSRLGKIQDKGDVALSLANALWIQKDFTLKRDFSRITDKYYGATPFLVDFIQGEAREKSRQKINLWVEDKTKDKIKNLIPKDILDAATRLVLTNAIYFKGNWAAQFKESQTKDAPFWTAEGKSTTIPMMHLTGSFKYMEDQDIQMLEMPYKGQDISMLVLLPKEKFGIKKLEQKLNYSQLKTWTSQLYKRKVDVYFPKFKMTCDYELKDVLTSMGMVKAFGNADFSGISVESLYIAEVIHKAFIEVNEEGSEAAAATAVVMKKAVALTVPSVFKAEHPFILLIWENTSGNILFMGRVSDPSVNP